MAHDEETIRVSGPLQVERLEDGDRKLLRDLVIQLGRDLELGARHTGFVVAPHRETGTDITEATVPEGFTTDFSSIPGPARALYRFDSVDLAGCCHDYAYFVGVPRQAADEIWRLVAISGKRHVSGWKGRLGYLALRAGGWWAYGNHAKKRAERERMRDKIDLTTGQTIGITTVDEPASPERSPS